MERTTKRRPSRDEVMDRQDTVGAGLDQLDKMIEQLTPTAVAPEASHQVQKNASEPSEAPSDPPRQSKGGLGIYDLATAALVLAMSGLIAIVFSPPPAWATCEDTCSSAGDGTCDDGGVDKWPFEGAKSGSNGTCVLGTDCGDCGARVFAIPKHWFIMACLVTTALLVVGVEQSACLVQDHLARDVYKDASNFRRIRVPLTDFPFGVDMINKLANSCQVREKALKVWQYIFKALAFCGYLSKEKTKMFKTLSKTTSIARRCFKFLRWVKHFEDLQEAREQKTGYMKFLLFFRVAANFGADWAEDVCSLERVGVLPAGTLSTGFMLFAEYCQLALALVEILVTGVRARKEAEVMDLARVKARDGDNVSDGHLTKQSRKLALVRLELVKYVSDVGKAIFDCELPYASERVFIGCSLFSGILSTHKNMVKILK